MKLYELLGIAYAKNLDFDKSKKYFDLAIQVQNKDSKDPYSQNVIFQKHHYIL